MKNIRNLTFIKKNFLLILIIALGLFLRFYKLSDLMVFIGDQGWFYLSARDLLIDGKIPLVGITSSHTWLHQGPLWTYMLAIVLYIFNYNPIGGAYLTIIVDAITILMIFKLGRGLFSDRVGTIAATLYAVSPLAIIHSRMPYHTMPIPLVVTLFLLSLYKWKQGNMNFFPLIILSLALLYNFELATVILFFVFVVVLISVILNKKTKVLFNKKIIVLSIIAFLVPMIPILLYDFSNGFKQTIIFLLWIPYSLFKPFIVPSGVSLVDSLSKMSDFVFLYNQRLVFLPNGPVALLISFTGFIYAFYKGFKDIKHRKNTGYVFVFISLLIPLVGLIVNRTPSEAYLPMLFPMLMIIIATTIDKLFKSNRILTVIMILFIAWNANSLISKNYLMDASNGYGPSLFQRMNVVNSIIRESGGKKYNIVGVGEGSQFESYTMNYRYLLWWKDKSEPVKDGALVTYSIEEKNGMIILKKIHR